MEDKHGMAAVECLWPRNAAPLFVGATIPHDHRAAAGPSLELVVRELVVLHLDRQPLGPRVHRWPLGDRPGTHHPADLEPQVKVMSGRLVLLDDEHTCRDATDRELLVPFDPRPRVA